VTPVWLVLPDPFSSRLFFDTGIVEQLHAKLDDRLELFLLDTGEQAEAWAKRAGDLRVTRQQDLVDERPPLWCKVHRRADTWLDRRMGFYPLSLRLSLRNRFHHERMRPGHSNWFLDPTLAGPLPRWQLLDPPMTRWHYGRARYLPRPLIQRLRQERPTVALANMQMHSVVPFIVGARRLGLTVIGNIASWDHTVGKGIVAPRLERYLVQNDVMRGDLVRYHNVDEARIVVTGWPQNDVFYRKRPRSSYEAVLGELKLDPSRPLVMVMGNTPTNAPYETQLIERLVGWWREHARARFSLLFRPHPRDREWRSRFAAALDEAGVAVQPPSFTDLETLAVLLQHGDAVVSNAGTILLDALANDRPAVCTLYDEGAPPGESWALQNVSGEHYKALFDSEAFYRANSFADLTTGIERALAHPSELAEERARVTQALLGEIDGRAATRVADAIAAPVT
jgi:hypothetical protein